MQKMAQVLSPKFLQAVMHPLPLSDRVATVKQKEDIQSSMVLPSWDPQKTACLVSHRRFVCMIVGALAPWWAHSVQSVIVLDLS
jgi:hypothetical protein